VSKRAFSRGRRLLDTFVRFAFHTVTNGIGGQWRADLLLFHGDELVRSWLIRTGPADVDSAAAIWKRLLLEKGWDRVAALQRAGIAVRARVSGVQRRRPVLQSFA
jgi:hypothetical protein